MVHILGGSLRPRVVSTWTKVQLPNEPHMQITVLINSESYLPEIYMNMTVQAYIFLIGFLKNSFWENRIFYCLSVVSSLLLL